MSAHEFTISVTDLDAGGKELRFPVRAAWIRGALEGHEATAAGPDGRLVIRASKSGPDVVVHGPLEAVLRVPCARCLEPFDLPVKTELSVMYVPAARARADKAAKAGKGAATEDGVELSEEEADTFTFEGDEVVLDDLVRDELTLEVPMIPLCSEACPGISPTPGKPNEAGSAEKGIDPRLAPLLQFRDKKV